MFFDDLKKNKDQALTWSDWTFYWLHSASELELKIGQDNVSRSAIRRFYGYEL